MGILLGTMLRCRVCGSSELETDVVLDRGTVLLATCERCDHRWTSRGEALPLARGGPAWVRARVELEPESAIA